MHSAENADGAQDDAAQTDGRHLYAGADGYRQRRTFVRFVTYILVERIADNNHQTSACGFALFRGHAPLNTAVKANSRVASSAIAGPEGRSA